MAFVIRFQGLMTFTKLEDNPPFVVLYRIMDPEHLALLSVNPAFIKSASGITQKPLMSTDLRCCRLHDVVTFEGLSGGPPNVDTELPDVRRLPTITDHGVNPCAAVKQKGGNWLTFAAFIDLTAGVLSQETFFRRMGLYDGATEKAFCVVRTVKLEAVASGDVTVRIGTESLTLDQNAEILISNLEEAMGGRSHHPDQAAFYEERNSVLDIVELDKEFCTDHPTSDEPLPRCATGEDFKVECSPTKFP